MNFNSSPFSMEATRIKNDQFFKIHRYKLNSERFKKNRIFLDAFYSDKFLGTEEFLIYLLDSLSNFSEENYIPELFQQFVEQLSENSKHTYDFRDKNRASEFIKLLYEEKLDGVIFELLKFWHKLSPYVMSVILGIIEKMASADDNMNELIFNTPRFELILNVTLNYNENIRSQVF